MKNLLFVVGLFVVLVLAVQPIMAQSSIEVPQIQVGTFTSFATNLASGTGERQLTVAVSFPKPFKVKPQVMVSLTMIDADTKANVRVNVVPEGVSRDGFTAVIKCWSDSKIHGVGGGWIAVAPVSVKVKK